MGNFSSGIYKGIAKKVETYDETNGKRTETLYIGEAAFDLINHCRIAEFISQRLLQAAKAGKQVSIALLQTKKSNEEEYCIFALKIDDVVYFDGNIPACIHLWKNHDGGIIHMFTIFTLGLYLIPVVIISFIGSRINKKHHQQGVALVEELRGASV